MSDPIIGMQQWFETPPGRYLLAWERAEFDRAVADIFGYHALQLGLPELDTLAANRMPHKWLALGAQHEKPDAVQPALLTDYAALPFEENSIDLVVLPHSLELNLDPPTTLREVERVPVPEGKGVVRCLDPACLTGPSFPPDQSQAGSAADCAAAKSAVSKGRIRCSTPQCAATSAKAASFRPERIKRHPRLA